MNISDFILLINGFFTKYIPQSVCICILCIILTLLIIIKVKKEWKMNGTSIINFSFHIILVTLLGLSIRVLNNKKIIDLLSEYWKIALILLLLITTIFIKECLAYSKTLDKILQSYCRAIYLLLLSVLFTLITINLDYTWDLIVAIIMFFMWGISNYEQNDEDTKTTDSFENKTISQASDVPIKHFDYLFPTRKKEFTRIYDYLKDIDTVDPYAVAINANWGEGKTSLINALQERLKNDNNEVIYLQPMILDTREKLLHYVFSQLETILINNKIYTGKGSPYKKYYELLMKFVNYKTIISFSNFFDIFPEDKKEDLRELKNDLERNIEKLALENKRIYIIVDDLDRVENETIYNTLTFIKEIVDLKRVTVLFLMDYKNVISEKITIDYLEKFINQKFDLAKINTNELFNYYLNDLIPSYKIKVVNKEVKVLSESFHEYLDVIYGYIQEKIQSKKKSIDDNKNKRDHQDNIELEAKLEVEIEELNKQLSDFKSKMSNARYVKKIICSIKETFDYLEKDLFDKSIDVNVDNKEIKISELIFKLNIFKILFKEHHDELSRLGNIKDFLSDTSDEFIITFFREQKGSILFESDQVLRDMKYDFYNSIIFSDKISNEIFNKIKSENEKLLDKFDSYEIYPEPCNFEELNKLLRAINYRHEETEEGLLNTRIEKFTNLVILSMENNLLDLHQIFNLLSESHRNILIYFPYFYKEVNKFLEHSQIEFVNKKSRDSALYLLKEVEYPLILKNKQSLLMLLKLYFFSGDASLTDSIESVANLHQLNKKLTEILNVKDSQQEMNSIKYFEKLFEIIKERILVNIKEDSLATRGYHYFKKDIENFIEVYELKTIISKNINKIALNKKALFEITNDILSTDEILDQLNELYIYIVKNRNEPSHQVFRFFHLLLNNIGNMINMNKEKLDKDNFVKLNEISICLEKSFEMNKGIYDKSSWYYCLIKLAELKRAT
ncbi:P-loop NTPase fold protein [Priestia aryabhattai]